MSNDNFNAKDVTRPTGKAPDPNAKFWDIADTLSLIHI